jgi:predicted unusual protein kinase regulating ubiquinone biosynthesis (AarF/ABC1/UbiB family)
MLEKGFGTMLKGIMDEWLKELGGELDFIREANNMSEARTFA